MPPKTLASAISAVAAEKFGKERVVPGRVSEVAVIGVCSPKAAARIYAAEPLTVECPEGYSGCAGVPDGRALSHGTYPVSGSVLGLPSVSLRRIAVIGRQNTYLYFEFQQAMPASVMATFSKANKCAFCIRLQPRLADRSDAMRFQVRGVFEAQKRTSCD